MRLSRKEIIDNNYSFPDNLVTLKYTDHFRMRLLQRGMGLEVVPTVVRVTKNNIYCATPNKNGKLTSVVVRLYYKSNVDMYLCFNPFNGSCISVWFRKRKGG